MHSSLGNFKILIADSDVYLSNVAKGMLKAMGFKNIQLTPNGVTAFEMIKQENFDFIITEWNLKGGLDGPTLVHNIRHSPESPNPTLPVIMLTGHKEQVDVQGARDRGVHEYVLKPFTSQTLYNRLERIVDFPRYFVVGGEFVGPDRRHRQNDAVDGERRQSRLTPQRKPSNATEVIGSQQQPALWLPDMSMKHKLGGDVKLESIITPAVLQQAQSVVNLANEASVDWIKKDIDDLQTIFLQMRQVEHPQKWMDEVVEIAVTISSRSGTFGYMGASKIAYQLYLFLRRNFNPKDANHYRVTDKYIEALNYIFASKAHNNETALTELAKELGNLTEKYIRVGA